MRSLAFATLFFALSCQTTGGSFFGFFPMPKFLSGSIESGIYRPADDSFQVWAPYSDAQDVRGKEIWRYGKVTESRSDGTTYVGFHPSDFEGARFHASCYDLEPDAPRSIAALVGEADERVAKMSGGTPFRIVHRGFSSVRPDLGFVVFSFDDGESYRGACALYIGVHGNRCSLLRVLISSFPADPEADAAKLRTETWDLQTRFARSFRVLEPGD